MPSSSTWPSRAPSSPTDVGGAREAVVDGETGFIVPPGDPLAMADRISELLSDPERARAMGCRGRRRAEEHFSCSAQLRPPSSSTNGSSRENRDTVRTLFARLPSLAIARRRIPRREARQPNASTDATSSTV